jgi:hypothetical protein
MAAISTLIAAAGVAVAAGGAVMSYQASQRQNEFQQQAITQQQEVERQRQLQMNLDASRRKREIIRSSIAARSASLAQTTAQGAAGPGGSSLAGAYGSIAGRTGVNWNGVDQNQQIGNSIFGAHQAQFQAYRGMADAQSYGAIGSGLSSLGGAMVQNAGIIGKVGSYFGSRGSSHNSGNGADF